MWEGRLETWCFRMFVQHANDDQLRLVSRGCPTTTDFPQQVRTQHSSYGIGTNLHSNTQPAETAARVVSTTTVCPTYRTPWESTAGGGSRLFNNDKDAVDTASTGAYDWCRARRGRPRRRYAPIFPVPRLGVGALGFRGEQSSLTKAGSGGAVVSYRLSGAPQPLRKLFHPRSHPVATSSPPPCYRQAQARPRGREGIW